MKQKSISSTILDEMNKYPKGTIFTNSDFYDLGNRSAIKTSLFRLAENNKIVRLIDGYYTIPYFSELIGEYNLPTVNQLAKKIAEKNVWTITPTGDTALNQIGLSTQVSSIYEYISDGPYREYSYLNRTIKFKHTSNRNITKYSKELSLIIQGIKTIGEKKVTNNDIKIMASFCEKYIDEDILKETKSVPAWVYQVLKKINEVIVSG